jgi:hypothetical protein
MPVSGQEFQIDAVLEDSFPASDPPSWTTGTAETGRAAVTPSGEETAVGVLRKQADLPASAADR